MAARWNAMICTQHQIMERAIQPLALPPFGLQQQQEVEAVSLGTVVDGPPKIAHDGERGGRQCSHGQHVRSLETPSLSVPPCQGNRSMWVLLRKCVAWLVPQLYESPSEG
ncbi:hypothetical protein NX059_006262 [Plenodomus lindquistii]|nr:hypothetical protein NX059_006262 [Plenodomus lindquistii]